MIVYDRLYGKIELGSLDLEIISKPEITRLHHISLSAIPDWLSPTGVSGSRFEHTLGVVHLAKLASGQFVPKDMWKDLVFASYVHDIGTPPFSHLAEPFQKLMFHENHEECVLDLLEGTELAKVIVENGGNIERISAFVVGGGGAWGELINGSIDLDNIDNALRYSLSRGLVSSKLFSAVNLVYGMMVNEKGISFTESGGKEFLGWLKCRLLTYKYVHSNANLSPGMMLFRAIDLAYRESEIPTNFFRMTDIKAYNFLGSSCKFPTGVLIERVTKWQFYESIFTYSSTSPTKELLEVVEDPKTRFKMADEIALMLNVPLWDICFYAGKDRGFKNLEKVLEGVNKEKRAQFEKILKPSWHIQVYMHQPGVTVLGKWLVRDYLKTLYNLDI